MFLPLLRKRSPSLSLVLNSFQSRQPSMKFSSVSPSHGHQFFVNCSNTFPFPEAWRGNMGSPQDEKSYQQSCSTVGSSLCRLQVPARTLSPGVTASSQASVCCCLGRLYGLQVDLCIFGSSMQGHSCYIRIFAMSCKGISFLAPGAPLPPPCPLNLVSEELFFSRMRPPLFSVQLQLCNNIFSLLNTLLEM